jgi:PhoPQ-activated pathogenicity-related protein
MPALARIRHHAVRPLTLALTVAVLGGATAGTQAPSTTARASFSRGLETALDRYVAAPDPHFRFDVAGGLAATGATATLLDMTSQQWLTTAEVAEPIWRHWLTVIRPPVVRSDVALLFITGASNDQRRPATAPASLVAIARDTGSVVAELRLVPNQPVVFQDDPARKPRYEDDFIAYTWDKFLRTGDDRWPARLPMTKSAVRAMDAVTAFVASPEGGASTVSRFVVAGASKRGWTTWTTAAVDTRVVAIAPIVIDLLNVERSFAHHWRAYGAWAEAIEDYVDQGIMDWFGTPELAALMTIEEPYEYRRRLTMPKLVLNASGDEFFLPDSSRFYLADLPGETLLRYVPNTGHNMDKTDALDTLRAFYASILTGAPRPSFTWTFESDGSIRVISKDAPRAVRLWQATNPTARDFRISTIGAAYRATTLTPVGPNTWVARLTAPNRGWTAGFVDLTFNTPAGVPLTLSTAIRVLPETLPFPPPAMPRAGAARRP